MTIKGTILVVEDTYASLKMVTELLTAAGFQVRPANSGEIALASVAANPPDLILLDINMPGMDGFEVIQRLKVREESRDIPVIFLSSSVDTERRVEGLKLGAVDFISKPFQREELLARVQIHMELFQLRARLEEQTADLTVANEQLNKDIIKRQQAEDALIESERRIKLITDNVPALIGYVDKDYRYQFVNRTYEKWFGVTRESIIGKNLKDLLPEEIYQLSLPNVNRALAGEEVSFEGTINLPDGTSRVFYNHLVPDRFLNDEIRGYYVLITDITELKKANEDKERLHGQLQQAQRIESIGRLAGGIAHDFNNMLGVILGHSEIALDQVAPEQPLHANLTEIHKAARRSGDLTRQLLAFARKQTISPRVVDMNEVVAGMLNMLQRLIGEDIHQIWLPGVCLWHVKIDPSQIDQILTNLFINARDAISGVGKVTIETDNISFDDAYCADHAGFFPGDYVLIAVSDDGCGMDKEIIDQIYEPFFTTKGVGQGTGLGLSTVYGIVKQNDGFINVYSEPGQGTTFKIYLPRHNGKATHSGTLGLPERVSDRMGKETVLVVEDEPALLDLSKIILEGQGYRVLTASTPGEAISLAKEYDGKVHLLITDVVMPEMNGRDLANELLSLHPNLKLLFMSGYTANVIAHHGILDEGVQFIHKPFSRKDLIAKIQEVLDKETQV